MTSTLPYLLICITMISSKTLFATNTTLNRTRKIIPDINENQVIQVNNQTKTDNNTEVVLPNNVKPTNLLTTSLHTNTTDFLPTTISTINKSTLVNNTMLNLSQTATISTDPTTSLATTIKPKKKFRILALMDYISSVDHFTYDSAATVAKRLIDENPYILPNHEVELLRRDVAARVGITYHIAHRTIIEDKHINAVLGPGTSAAAELSSELLTKYGLLQVSFAALNPALGDKTKMPYLFRSNPSLDAYTSSVIALFKKNGWKRAAIIYDHTNAILLRTAFDLQKLLHENGITLALFEQIDSNQISTELGFTKPFDGIYQDLVSKIKKVKDADIRVVIGVFEFNIARHVFCEIYKGKLYGQRYTWIIPNGNSFLTWADIERPMSNCTNDNLKESSRGMLLFRTGPKRIDGKMTIANKTADEIWDLVRQEKLKICTADRKVECSYNLNALYVYEALWALAITFSNAEKQIKNFSIGRSAYFDQNTARSLSNIMEKVEFEGASGFYSYKGEHRTRTAELVLTQYNDGSPFTTDSIYKYYGIIGYSNGQDDSITINETIQRLIIPNYTIPRDGPILFFPAEQFHLGNLVFAWTFSVGGILLALIFLYVNIRYKDKLLIKMSSPNINNVIIIGCIFCYISVILYGFDSRTVAPSQIPLACNAVVVFLILGFTLAFGSLFSKTWRIYRIFTNTRTLHKTGIRDFHLFIVVFIMMAIDCVIIALWMTLSPFQLAEQKLETTLDVELDKVTTPIIHRCSCEYYIQFAAATYVYKGLLLIFGLFVAWETRRIKVTVLNDSKYIGMSVYIVALFSSIAAVVTHSLSNTTSFEASYVIFAICIFSCTTVTLCFVFLPKFYFQLQHNKLAKTILSECDLSEDYLLLDSGCSIKLKKPQNFDNNRNDELTLISSALDSYCKGYSVKRERNVILLTQDYEDPNFKNGRPVIDGESIGVYSDRSYEFAQSMSDVDHRVYDNEPKSRADTAVTQTSAVMSVSGSVNESPFSMIAEYDGNNTFNGDIKFDEEDTYSGDKECTPSLKNCNKTENSDSEPQNACYENGSLNFVNPRPQSPSESEKYKDNTGWDDKSVNNEHSGLSGLSECFKPNRLNAFDNHVFQSDA